MRNLKRLAILCALAVLLVTCDIQPVSVGEWAIAVSTPSGDRATTWTINVDRDVAISDDYFAVFNGSTVLEGSRVVFSGEMPHPEETGRMLGINFNGTVDGNRLQGTLFSILGNWSVSGTRQ